MKSRTKDIVLVALTVALTSAGAYLRIPIGPVPITLQTFFVLLSGAVLGPLLGATAMFAYLVLGLAGLPVFTSGGGPQYILSPTFGFLLSFPLASAVVGLVLRGEGPKVHRRRIGAAMFLGTFLIYLVGVPYLGLNLKWIQHKEVGTRAVIMMGMIPFLPGDLLKILFGTWVVPPILRVIKDLRP
ncbi:MAG: biotin transporter BioY [Deltaproteobacteria bacterium]|nr:biotin transporter BioY [Deltaproteobacteria bacterium]